MLFRSCKHAEGSVAINSCPAVSREARKECMTALATQSRSPSNFESSITRSTVHRVSRTVAAWGRSRNHMRDAMVSTCAVDIHGRRRMMWENRRGVTHLLCSRHQLDQRRNSGQNSSASSTCPSESSSSSLSHHVGHAFLSASSALPLGATSRVTTSSRALAGWR